MAVIAVNDSNFKSQLEGKKVIVKYFADWCGSCKLFAPKFKRLSNDERFSGIEFLEVNAEENPESRKFVGVDNLPFFAVVDNGEVVEGTSTSKEEYVVKMLEKLG
ncbi:thioredoxin family protein [Luteibaculum oceani]|uniref:Thioredoxin family protein n=1 Tax=Luteibaculum oceani TaxID=1294296 RepID=A0A5C6V134_9FLAO|nr:thioredoxin family protein [Luteibaculum oceani]TXC78590.1 thioredoxin family protein [Luteibaculum oceani]